MDKTTRKSMLNYNKKAKSYENTFDGKFTLPFNVMIRECVQLKDGYKVLDVASGNGRLLRMLSEKASIEAFGVDISDEMVKTASSLNPNMTFLVSGADQLPFEDGTFDVITVCCAFHHFVKPAEFLKEAYRVLKKGGTLILAEPYLPIVLRQLENLILPLLPMGDVRTYSKKELLKFYKKAHFKNATIKQNGMRLLITGTK